MTTPSPKPTPLRLSPEVAAEVEAAKRAPTPLLWSPTEASIRLGISRATVYELLARGELASLKVGARRLIPDAECRRFIAARLAESADG